jgi:hypothetical protein
MSTFRKIILGIGGFCLLTLSQAGLAVDLSAKKDGVKVLAEASKSASVVSTLKKGDSVKSINRKGMFWEVELAGGKKGFVAVLDVSRQAGSSDNSLAKAIRSAAQEGRSQDSSVDQARSRTAVMGVRGLDENEETSFAGNVKPNLRRVYMMEDRIVEQKALDDLASLVAKEMEARAEKKGL